MTYLAISVFFTFALLGSSVAVPLMVLRNRDEILLALRGRLGLHREAARDESATVRTRVALCPALPFA